MKKIFSAAVIIIIAFNLRGVPVNAVGTAKNKTVQISSTEEIITKEYDVKNFTSLDIGMAFKIRVKQGASFKVTATGTKDDISKVSISVTGNELEVEFPYNLLEVANSRDITIEITMPALEKVDFGGASESVVSGFVSKNLNVMISGASTSKVDVKTDFINLDVSGASNLNITGETKEMKSEISGASGLNAFAFKANKVKVNVTGASTAQISVTEELDAKAIAASSISYKGNPAVHNTNATGASTIRKVE